MFQINDKVVCVEKFIGSGNTTGGYGGLPQVGTVYVIRSFSSQGGPRLVGLCAGYWWDGEEASWVLHKFRKLSDIKAENAAKRWEVRSA
jgi:proteasome assembly chaperone (PAC2) family protein